MGSPPSTLLEREHELELIDRALDLAVEGAGTVLCVNGPAGIGKSSLLAETERAAAARGFTVLGYRSDPLLTDASFAGVRELLRSLVSEIGVNNLDGAARFALPVFEGSPITADRDRVSSVLNGLYWLVAGIVEARGPTVITIDDAQWLDGPSARFVEHLARRTESLSLLLLVALRAGEPLARPEFESQLTAVAAQVVRLRPLSETASARVVRDVLGPRADEDVCLSCHEATLGNPFYLHQLARAVQADGDRPTVDLASKVRRLGIETVSASVLLRLSRLGENCAAVAEALAILGQGTPIRHIVALTGLDHDAVALAVDRLQGADLATNADGISFVHPVVNEAVRAQIQPARAASLHGRAAGVLEDEGASSDRVAVHLLAAEATGDPGTVSTLRAAAGQALRQGAPEAAVSYLRRALNEPPDQALRPAVLLELGRAEALLPTIHDFSALREAVSLVTEPEARAELTRELALGLCGVFRNRDACTLVHALLEELEDQLKPATVRALDVIVIAVGVDELSAAERVRTRAARYLPQALSGEIDDPRLLAALAVERGVSGGPSDVAVALATRALEDDRLIGEWLDSGYVTALLALLIAGEPAAAAAAAQRGIVVASHRGSTPMLLQLSIFRSEAALIVGDLDLAEEYSERARALAVALGPEHHAGVGSTVMHLERGRLDLAQAAAVVGDSPIESLWMAQLRAERGAVRIASGDPVAGLADLFEADAATRGAGLELSTFVDWVPAATDALVSLGRRAEAVKLAGRELAEARAFGASLRLGIALSVHGSLSGGREATCELQEAVALLDASGARLEQARALLRLGVHLRTQSDVAKARSTLTEALDLADRCGGWALVETVRAELLASGARPRRTRTSGPNALTPAELRVAQMASAGMTNRAIAETLFVSAKTVETHLSQCYTKLGIDRRDQLAAALSVATEPVPRV